MLSPEEAWGRLEPFARPLPAVTVPRREALGRVLARPLAATVEVPAADVSAMDGFAVAGPAPVGEPVPIAGVVAAGEAPGRPLPAGTALRIMTGAPVPEGADRVIPVERARVERRGPGGGGAAGAEAATFEIPGAAGDHVRRRGEIARSGEALLPAGALLTPGALALLATHGHAEVTVHRRPRVAVLVTGDEVVPPAETPGPGQLRDSHTDFLLAACRSLGLEPQSLGIVPDDRELLRERIEQGLEADVLLISGGVSMGEYDLVEGVLQELRCHPLFDAVAIQPGKPLVAAVAAAHHEADGSVSGGHALVFGLPGNPASAIVCFWLFVRPALRRLLGRSDGFWQGALRGELAAPLPAGKKDRDRFLAAEVAFAEGRLEVTPVAPVGSHDLAAYARGTALVRIPPGSPERLPGEVCEVLPLVDWGE
ncbi:MAG TPA: gephyrin-like molybdotransferase Glp [Thermoanaerobaculia bacterium]|nr:gephyrin-like molybdotransferase Glp [Thermoanaerobaculia bacterium]